MSRKKSTKKGQRKKSNGSFGELTRNNWGKVLTALMTALVAGAGWYFARCLSDRKDLIKEFRQTALSFRLINEKMDRDVVTLERQITSFVDYLEGGQIEIAGIREREDKILSLTQLTNNDCNLDKEAFYKWKANGEIVVREFFLTKPNWPDIFPECGALTEMSVTLPDAQRLVDEADYRNDFIYSLRPQLDKSDEMLERAKKAETAIVRFDAELLATIEARDSSIAKSIWDCLKHLFGIRGR